MRTSEGVKESPTTWAELGIENNRNAAKKRAPTPTLRMEANDSKDGQEMRGLEPLKSGKNNSDMKGAD